MNGLLVKEWMKKQRIKPEELAIKLGVGYPTVRAIMAGKKVYTTTIKLLAMHMGIPDSDLLNPSKKKGPSQGVC